MSLARRVYHKAKRLIAGPGPLPPLDPSFAAMESVYRSPPITRDLQAAIKLIAPQFDLGRTEQDRAYWEADQNGACWGEYESLKDILTTVPKDGKILEIGPGMGRSLIFFAKKLGWSNLYAFEGEGKKTKYTLLGPRFEDSFCGNIGALREILDYNGLTNVTIFDAAKMKLSEVPGQYQLVYSFFCIGFHWAIEHFIDDILRLLAKDGVGLFTTTQDFVPPACFNRVHYEVIDYRPSMVGAWHKLIVVRSR